MSYTIFIKRYEPFFQEFLFLFEEFSDILWCFDKIFPPPPPSFFDTPSETARNVPTNICARFGACTAKEHQKNR